MDLGIIVGLSASFLFPLWIVMVILEGIRHEKE